MQNHGPSVRTPGAVATAQEERLRQAAMSGTMRAVGQGPPSVASVPGTAPRVSQTP